MFKKVLFAVVLVLLLLVGVVATRPAEFHVERSITMAAAPADAYAIVSDFRQWSRFSPWAKLDPNQVETHSGSAHGKGAVYAWKGNSDAGEGRMTITGVKPNQSVTIKLEFIKPFAATNTVTFSFKAVDEARTSVTWAMEGTNDFMGKAFSLIVDMDAMVGKDFAAGLADLAKAAEADVLARRAAAAPTEVPVVPAEADAQAGEDALAAETTDGVVDEAGDAEGSGALAAQPQAEPAVDGPSEGDPDLAAAPDAPSELAPDEEPAAVAAPTE